MNGYTDFKPKRYVMEMANDFERKFPYKTSAILKVRNQYLCGMLTEVDAVMELVEIYHREVELKQENLRIGSILEDVNGERHTVIRFEGIFTVTTYGNGENWLVDSHLKDEKLIKY